MKYTEINIKEDMPVVADAMRCLKDSLTRLKHDKCECVLVVHGYGSTGKGGAICKSARQWLKAQERGGKLKAVIFGEDFNIFTVKAIELKNRFPELAPLMTVCNHGVTVVEL